MVPRDEAGDDGEGDSSIGLGLFISEFWWTGSFGVVAIADTAGALAAEADGLSFVAFYAADPRNEKSMQVAAGRQDSCKVRKGQNRPGYSIELRSSRRGNMRDTGAGSDLANCMDRKYSISWTHLQVPHPVRT